MWRRGVVVIATAQLHSTKPELRFCAGSSPARGVSEIRDGEDLWQWSRLEIRLRLSSVNHTTKTIHHHHHHHQSKGLCITVNARNGFFFIWLQCLVSLYHRSMLFLLNKSHCIVGLLVIQVLLLNFVGPWVKMPK